MKRFLKFFAIILSLVLVFVLVAGFFIPEKYHFERSIVIAADKEEIWENISMFSNFQKWNPWSNQDPSMEQSISGTDGTPGAIYNWKGNNKVGAGRQTILEIAPFEHIILDMELNDFFEKKAGMSYTLTKEPNGYKLTWSFDTENKYPWNAITELFMNPDKQMDKDFSTGLSNLKKLCERNKTYTAYQSKAIYWPASNNEN